MTDPIGLAPFTITVFTRHSTTCPDKNNPLRKCCNGRKSLSIREGGTTALSFTIAQWLEQRFALAEIPSTPDPDGNRTAAC